MNEEFDVARWREYVARWTARVTEGFRRVRYVAGRVILVLALVYLGFGIYLFFAQRWILYRPAITDPGSCARFETNGTKKLVHNETTLYYKQNGPNLAVFYHGNVGTVCDRKFLADFFDERGFSFVFVEYTGYGDGRKSTEEALERNLRDAEDFIGMTDYDRLILMGESLGTALAAKHAVLRDPDILILVSPYTSIVDIAKAHFPIYPVSFLVWDDFRTDLSGKRFNGRLLVIHGEADEIIPFSQGETVFVQALFSSKEFLLLDNALHNDTYSNPKTLRTISRYITPTYIPAL